MDYSTIKVSKNLATWLKTLARRENKYMYGLLEEICEKGMGGRPWDLKKGRKAR